MELDSHADSPVVGKHARILERTDKTVKVSGFTEDLGGSLSVPVVNAAVAYDCDTTGNTYILIIHNALYLKNMEVNLLPPFMMRLAGLEVNECPKFLAKSPSVEDHSVYFPELDVRLPFMLDGVISYLPTRKPHVTEISSHVHLVLTPNSPAWDPHTNVYSQQENAMTNYRGEMCERPWKRAKRISCFYFF